MGELAAKRAVFWRTAYGVDSSEKLAVSRANGSQRFVGCRRRGAGAPSFRSLVVIARATGPPQDISPFLAHPLVGENQKQNIQKNKRHKSTSTPVRISALFQWKGQIKTVRNALKKPRSIQSGCNGSSVINRRSVVRKWQSAGAITLFTRTYAYLFLLFKSFIKLQETTILPYYAIIKYKNGSTRTKTLQESCFFVFTFVELVWQSYLI